MFDFLDEQLFISHFIFDVLPSKINTIGWSGSKKMCEYQRDQYLKRKILVPIAKQANTGATTL
jgi:hypothetical protein